MKKTTILNMLMVLCFAIAIESLYQWGSYLIAIMFGLLFFMFWIMIWFVTATEMPEDYDEEQINNYKP